MKTLNKELHPYNSTEDVIYPKTIVSQVDGLGSLALKDNVEQNEVNGLTTSLNNIKQDITTNTNDITTLKNDNETNKTNISTNTNDINSLKEYQTTSTQLISKNTNDILDLRDNYDTIEDEYNNLSEYVYNDLSDNIGKIEENITTLKNDFKSLKGKLYYYHVHLEFDLETSQGIKRCRYNKESFSHKYYDTNNLNNAIPFLKEFGSDWAYGSNNDVSTINLNLSNTTYILKDSFYYIPICFDIYLVNNVPKLTLYALWFSEEENINYIVPLYQDIDVNIQEFENYLEN